MATVPLAIFAVCVLLRLLEYCGKEKPTVFLGGVMQYALMTFFYLLPTISSVVSMSFRCQAFEDGVADDEHRVGAFFVSRVVMSHQNNHPLKPQNQPKSAKAYRTHRTHHPIVCD